MKPHWALDRAGRTPITGGNRPAGVLARAVPGLAGEKVSRHPRWPQAAVHVRANGRAGPRRERHEFRYGAAAEQGLDLLMRRQGN